jgi:hypothetical protein
MRARYNSPSLGRFHSVDPLGLTTFLHAYTESSFLDEINEELNAVDVDEVAENMQGAYDHAAADVVVRAGRPGLIAWLASIRQKRGREKSPVDDFRGLR